MPVTTTKKGGKAVVVAAPQEASSNEKNKGDQTDTIVTQREGNAKDECSDLTDNNNNDDDDDEEQIPRCFPQKLMDILTDENNVEIVSWLPHGNGFIIHKKKSFANDILPKFFKASKFTSFTRKLNRWGFSRVPRGPECGSYFHRLFRREKPTLCLQMTSNSGTKYQSNPLQQQLLPTGPGMQGGMPNVAYPFMNMANGTPQQQQQQQAMWQHQMQQMMQMQQMHMMQMQQHAAAGQGAAPAAEGEVQVKKEGHGVDDTGTAPVAGGIKSVSSPVVVNEV